ncbi:MAG: hypothetical protein LBU81_01265 [Methanosarcinales archaeon]|nr:hypothetical protein [Methanosarcinales archaeon]
MVEKNTPSINPKEFELMKSGKYTLACYGELPSKSGVESYNWHLLLLQITGSVQNDTELEKYGYTDGSAIIGYGATYTGGFVQVNVDIERAGLLTQNDLDSIHSIFEKHANKYGVKNLPLVIACENQIQYTMGPDDRVRPIIGGVQVQGYNSAYPKVPEQSVIRLLTIIILQVLGDM